MLWLIVNIMNNTKRLIFSDSGNNYICTICVKKEKSISIFLQFKVDKIWICTKSEFAQKFTLQLVSNRMTLSKVSFFFRIRFWSTAQSNCSQNFWCCCHSNNTKQFRVFFNCPWTFEVNSKWMQMSAYRSRRHFKIWSARNSNQIQWRVIFWFVNSECFDDAQVWRNILFWNDY